ncbi:hypothetical protein C9I89_02920 [Photobacterium lipolyticum]|uniref:Uncharacterized protein n=1 Tax=Photobacterium lipolyticum TaxID=266810 RepID=A0A2T3N2C8_9GAMM|nr:hypothetical protein C9I89_02920 [Photobacterium lipolyticum]
MPNLQKLKHELIGGELYRFIKQITDVGGKSQKVVGFEERTREFSFKFMNFMWVAEIDASRVSMVKEVETSIV